MPRTTKKRLFWRDIHPRAQRLLTDGTNLEGVMNAPEEVQIAFINGLYKAADLTAISANQPVRVPLREGERVLPRYEINVLTGVASRLANAKFTKPDLLAEATRIMRILDRIDAVDGPAQCEDYVTSLERRAKAEAARDRRAGRPSIPLYQRVNRLRAADFDKARVPAVEVSENGGKK